MAWVEQLPNGRWRAGWRDSQQRKRSKSGFVHRAAAQRYAGEQESKARRGESAADGRAPTWGDWLPQWQAARVVEASTARQDQVRIDRYLVPRWGKTRLNRVKRSDVQAWINGLTATERYDGRKHPADDEEAGLLSPATVDRIYRLFSASMKAAVLDEGVPLSTSPCVGIKLPTVAPGHERYLTRGEFDLVASYLEEPYRFAAILLVATGMRFGEMAGLHWQRVNLADGAIDIVETWAPAAQAIKAYPKGKVGGRRSVPIVSWLREALEAQIDTQGPPAPSCGQRHTSGVRCRSGLVVTAPGGQPLDGHNLGRRQWQQAWEQAGVGHIRLHDLRHTYASWLVQDGVPLQEVQRLLGHASIITTQRYAHLGTSQHARVLAALDPE
jgi:integrase